MYKCVSLCVFLLFCLSLLCSFSFSSTTHTRRKRRRIWMKMTLKRKILIYYTRFYRYTYGTYVRHWLMFIFCPKTPISQWLSLKKLFPIKKFTKLLIFFITVHSKHFRTFSILLMRRTNCPPKSQLILSSVTPTLSSLFFFSHTLKT